MKFTIDSILEPKTDDEDKNMCIPESNNRLDNGNKGDTFIRDELAKEPLTSVCCKQANCQPALASPLPLYPVRNGISGPYCHVRRPEQGSQSVLKTEMHVDGVCVSRCCHGDMLPGVAQWPSFLTSAMLRHDDAGHCYPDVVLRTPTDDVTSGIRVTGFWNLQSQIMNSTAGVNDTSPAIFFPSWRKPKRSRTAFTPSQLKNLERAFGSNHYVVGQERRDLANNLDLTETQVKVWFQNRRTKQKRLSGEEIQGQR